MLWLQKTRIASYLSISVCRHELLTFYDCVHSRDPLIWKKKIPSLIVYNLLLTVFQKRAEEKVSSKEIQSQIYNKAEVSLSQQN